MKKILILLFFPLMIFTQESTLIGDVDCSGEVNSEDASLILQFVTNVIDELPCQDNMTGLTPEQLQEIMNMMDEQLSISYSGGNNNYPTMISNISEETMYLSEAFIYCAELEENGYTDWFLPSYNQLTYAISGGCEYPDIRTDNHLWTSQKDPGSVGNYAVIIRESGNDSSTLSYSYGQEKCRCVRFGEGEAISSSSNSSNSAESGSSILGNSEQPILMIGPMYKQLEFINFNHYYKHNYPDNTGNYIYYSDAIRFCSQLSYNGYNDWFLPSFRQIQNYLKDNPNDFIIPNFNENSSYYFWLFLNEIQTSGNGGYLYSPTIEVTGALHEYPNMVTVFISYSLSDYMPHCFCVR